jgi:4-alpha-glucanotransferase
MHTSTHPPGEPRSAGILLHPTSLPSAYGIGDLGDELIAFLDWAASAGMRVWQVLPLNPPGYGYSPYGCLSSFAGNPLLISPQKLLQDGLLEASFVAEIPQFPHDQVDFDRVSAWKFGVLRESWRRFNETGEHRAAFEEFVEAEDAWLDEYASFMARKERNGGVAWWDWKVDDVKDGETDFWKYVQFLFFRQWAAVREAARARGITIMGDVPIYVACDSADVWANRELFQLDDQGSPTVVAGVPPDYFSTTGQRWGNPLYRWDVMRETNYRWWVARIRANLRLADVIRLDHFRGFAAYWEIPADEPTAIHGRWMPGPGIALFDAVREELGDLPLVAEDLGFITEDVHALRHAVGLPGMKILQFGFAQNDSPHLPHRYETQTVAYTGTHDNDTARGWFTSAPEAEQEAARLYLGCNDDDIAWTLIRAAYTSVARTAIVPAQDVLNLDGSARMNRPGASKDNWSWRMLAGALTHEHAVKLRRLAEVTGRL